MKDLFPNNRPVTIFLPSLRGGGAEHIMVLLANELMEKGFQVHIVVVQAQGPNLKKVKPGVRIVALESKHTATSLLKLVGYLRRHRPRVVLSAMRHANILAICAKYLSGGVFRLVVSERNNVTISNKMNKSNRFRCMTLFMRLTYGLADKVVAISSGVADDLSEAIGLDRDKIDVVYNPVDVRSIQTLGRQPVSHPWLNSNQYKVILGVGRLTMQKNFSILIHAFSKLDLNQTPEPRLIILGEGEDRPKLTALAKDLGLSEKIDFPGFKDNPYAWMQRATALAVSSLWEGFCNVLLEAMACGLPVVSADCPHGPGEILERGKWGTLVPVGDVPSLATALTAILNEADHRHVKERAFEFTLDRAVKGYLKAMSLS